MEYLTTFIKFFLQMFKVKEPVKNEQEINKEEEAPFTYVISDRVKDTAKRVSMIVSGRIEHSHDGYDFIRYDFPLIANIVDAEVFRNGLHSNVLMMEELFDFIKNPNHKINLSHQEDDIEQARLKSRELLVDIFLGEHPFCAHFPVIKERSDIQTYPVKMLIIEITTGYNPETLNGGVSVRTTIIERDDSNKYVAILSTPYFHYHKE